MDPCEADHVTPTLDVLVTSAVNCIVPAEVTVAIAGVTVTLTVAAGTTVIGRERTAVCLWLEESATWTVKVKAPVCEVVPESRPLLCRLMPEGRAPDESVQVYGAVPPFAPSVLQSWVPAVTFPHQLSVTTLWTNPP